MLKVIIISLLSLPVFASAGVEINWWKLGSQYKENPALGWYIVSFVIFAAGLIFAISKPLGVYLETRAKDIKKAISEAAAAKDDAARRIAAYEKRLSTLDQEVLELRADFQEQGKKEQARLATEAEAISRQIIAETSEIIDAEVTRAKVSLKAEAAQLSVSLAKNELSSGKIGLDSLALNNKFLSDVSKLEQV